SHGALVAAAYAIAFPHHVRKLVLVGGLAAFTPEMKEEGKGPIEATSGEPWPAAAVAALEREEAGEYETQEDTAQLWNEMLPVYFSTWDERYRPLVEADPLPPQPRRPVHTGALD